MEIVAWELNYATGIKYIDAQHKELVNLTNRLYRVCMTGDEQVGYVEDAVSCLLGYIRFHFDTEKEFLERIGYPDYRDHIKQHETLINNILSRAEGFNTSNKITLNAFVRTLAEWIFGHIVISDKDFAAFASEQRRNGLLTGNDLEPAHNVDTLWTDTN
jgi:hemerythrin